ncbi:hypothetical protein [Symbioplanes lichenis]|uniref:hypothetical protein n=1 Tax=Symbioplanes lichenis TaxID=1629072 RepID=UPI0034DABD6F
MKPGTQAGRQPARPAQGNRPATPAAQGNRPGAQPGRQAAQGTRPAPAAGAGGEDQAERGLRGLVGSGSSQVSVTAALRARDAARPTDEDIAAAEAGLTIVRRNWVPREDLPRR